MTELFDCVGTPTFVPSEFSGSTIDSLKKRIIQTSYEKEATAAELEELLRLTAAQAVAGKNASGGEPITAWEDQASAHWDNAKQEKIQTASWVNSSEPHEDKMNRVEEREERMSRYSLELLEYLKQ